MTSSYSSAFATKEINVLDKHKTVNTFNSLLNEHLNEPIRDHIALNDDLRIALPQHESLSTSEKNNIRSYLFSLITKFQDGKLSIISQDNLFQLINYYLINPTQSDINIEDKTTNFIASFLDKIKKNTSKDTPNFENFAKLLDKLINRSDKLGNNVKEILSEFYQETLSELQEIETMGNSLNFICLSFEKLNTTSLKEIIDIIKRNKISEKLRKFKTDNVELKAQLIAIADKIDEIIEKSTHTNDTVEKSLLEDLRSTVKALSLTYQKTLQHCKELATTAKVIEEIAAVSQDIKFAETIRLCPKTGDYKSIDQYIDDIEHRLGNTQDMFDKAIAKIDDAIKDVYRRLTRVDINDDTRKEKEDKEENSIAAIKKQKEFDKSMKLLLSRFFKIENKNSEKLKNYIRKLWHMTRTLDSIEMEHESKFENSEKKCLVSSFYKTAKNSFQELQKGYENISNESRQILDLFDMILDEKLKNIFN